MQEQPTVTGPFALRNVLLEKVDFQVTRTRTGTWRRFLWPTGELFEEFRSDQRFFGLPLVHYTRGRSPETGRRVVARGVIAVGRKAIGIFAFGQGALGVVAVGQASAALLLGVGQATVAPFAVGQAAIGLVVGLGQVATGWIAVGQVGVGKFVLAQFGLGPNVWDARAGSPEAEAFFRGLLRWPRR
jgi:hypothetical protein